MRVSSARRPQAVGQLAEATGLEAFARAREAERAWTFANGYNNGDPAANGEYACLDMLLDGAEAFVDVGANEGLFLARVKPGVPVLAFEPNPAHRASIEARLPSGGRLEAVALSDAPGRATLHVHHRHHAAASLTDRPRMSPSFRAGMTRIETQVAVLDAYAPQLSGRRLLIKIDAEGYEAPVMRGAARLLAEAPAAAVMFEHSFAWLESGEGLLAAYQFLDGLGFEVYRILPLGLEHVRFFTNDMERAQYCNYLAVRGFDLGPFRALATPYGETRFRPFG